MASKKIDIFGRAKSKLEDALINFETMKEARDSTKFKSAFTSFLSNYRAITYALQKEGAHISEFKNWYKQKQEEMSKDELLRFFHESRIDDFHKGEHCLEFNTYIKSFSSDNIGPPPHRELLYKLVARAHFGLLIVIPQTKGESPSPKEVDMLFK